MQFIVIALLLCLLSIWGLIRLSRKQTKPDLGIEKRATLFDAQSRDFKKQLAVAVEQDFEIYPRLHLADLLILKYKPKDKASLSMQQKIASLSVDFVLVDKLSGRIACLVQLDQEQEETEHYKLLENCCQQAKLPLVHFAKQGSEDTVTIRKQIMSVLEPTIELGDIESNDIKVYLEPVTKQTDSEHAVMLETS